jgi:hypothetical protein
MQSNESTDSGADPFVCLLLSMGGLAMFAIWRFVVVLADHPSERPLLVLAALIGAVVMVLVWPALKWRVRPARHEEARGARMILFWLALVVALLGIIAAAPERGSLTLYW